MFSKIDINDIKGFHLGNATNHEAGTGCTVIVSEEGAVAGVDVRGGGPATRETDLLRSENSIQKIHAVVLSGGSAFGLEAGSGVMRELEDRGIGFKMGKQVVPIVCQASLYDLEVGKSDVRPDRSMGVKAVRDAFSMGRIEHGNCGAGTGASVGKFYGMNRAMKTGLGTFACSDGDIEVGAITAVNAFADVYDGNNNLIAGLLSADGKRIEGTIRPLKNCIAASNAEHRELRMESIFRRNNFYRTASQNEVKEALTEEKSHEVNSESENTAEESAKYNPFVSITPDAPLEENFSNKPEENKITTEENPNYADANADDDGLGYDIIFNTTISCLITNAKLTKAQCNKLASILHDGYARSIKPVHSTLDGDTIFVMSTGEKDVNFDAFAALATDIMQFSVIDGAISAKSEYGLPAASEFLK